MKKQKRFVAYYRVSTKKQSKEMAAQKTAVKDYLKNRWPPEKKFTEIESGKRADNRAELQKALQYCQDNNCTLVVAKLDRLSRDLEFIAKLQKSKISFVCCDMPDATRETISFMGVMAQWERDQITKRTKEALAEKRKQGVKLGSHNPKVKAGLEKFRKKQAKEMAQKKEMAIKRKLEKQRTKKPITTYHYEPVKETKREIADQKVWPIIKTLRGEGYTYEKIATALTTSKHDTRQGGKWSQTAVIRIAKRNEGRKP